MAPDLASLVELKAHLRLASDDEGEDGYLGTLLIAAQRSCELAIGRDLATDPTLTAADLAVLKHAVLLLAGQAYDERGGAGAPPAAVEALLRPLRSFAR